jgi:hypothetical protein
VFNGKEFDWKSRNERQRCVSISVYNPLFGFISNVLNGGDAFQEYTI